MVAFGLIFQYVGSKYRQKKIAIELTETGGSFKRDWFHNVIELRTSGSDAAELRKINELSSLRELSISNSKLDNLDFLKQAPSIEKLSFDKCHTGGLLSILEHQNLTRLRISTSSVEFVHAFSEIKHLNSLNLINMTPTKSFNANSIPDFPHLKHLGFCGYEILNESRIARYSQLESLSFYACEIESIDFVSSLKRLKKLDLNGASVVDYSVLKQCPSLELIVFGGMLESSLEDDLEKIKSWLPNCTIL
jgi:hypothetical protein